MNAPARSTVAPAARTVDIQSITLVHWQRPHIVCLVTCSKGTYIRVLAADIGAALGCGAHLTALRRTEVGDLTLGGAVTLVELEALDEAQRLTRLAPVDALLQSLDRLDATPDASLRFRHGNPIDMPPGLCGKIRVYDGGQLIGVGEAGREGRLWPKRLVHLLT